jgi:hypothetical protein
MNSSLPIFLVKAVSTACHASNGLFLHKIYNMTQYELLTGPSLTSNTFEYSVVSVLLKNKKERLSKFQSRIMEDIFIGYASDSHTYRYYNPTNGKVEVSCDVDFDDNNGSQPMASCSKYCRRCRFFTRDKGYGHWKNLVC